MKTGTQPFADGLPKRGDSLSGRIVAKSAEIGNQCLLNQLRRRVLRFADGQGDVRLVYWWRNALLQPGKFLKWVRLQFDEMGVHRACKFRLSVVNKKPVAKQASPEKLKVLV